MSSGFSDTNEPAGRQDSCSARHLAKVALRHSQGGTAPGDERAVFTAVAHVLTSGCAWRQLPETFGVSRATTHRRFTARTRGIPLTTLSRCGCRPACAW
ncbi:transposase [Streptomyces prunicolor]|uniref:transposase n=1 Tax=Streptomyces prunicolor TaxID=67348 RepID=UPI003866D535